MLLSYGCSPRASVGPRAARGGEEHRAGGAGSAVFVEQVRGLTPQVVLLLAGDDLGVAGVALHDGTPLVQRTLVKPSSATTGPDCRPARHPSLRCSPRIIPKADSRLPRADGGTASGMTTSRRGSKRLMP